jgi:hypothetical protein
MKHRAYMTPHEAELIDAVDHHYRSALETARYTRRLVADRCRKRAEAERKAA